MQITSFLLTVSVISLKLLLLLYTIDLNIYFYTQLQLSPVKILSYTIKKEYFFGGTMILILIALGTFSLRLKRHHKHPSTIVSALLATIMVAGLAKIFTEGDWLFAQLTALFNSPFYGVTSISAFTIILLSWTGPKRRDFPSSVLDDPGEFST